MMKIRRRSAVFATLGSLCMVAKMASATSVGEKVTDFTLPDFRGNDYVLSTEVPTGPVVIAFLGTECPLAKLYAPRLQSLAEEYGPQGVQFVAINSNTQDSLREIEAYVRRHGLEFPVLKDRRAEVARMFGATRTPEVFLLDSKRVVRYQGRIDDQYVVGIQRDGPTREDLREALDELLGGEPVSLSHAPALGCLIGRPKVSNSTGEVTYAKHIAPILRDRCVECHREGEIGPFALEDYEQASGWGEMMVEVIRERRMPPWHADPKYGHFANDRSMDDSEKELIYRWVADGCPEGDSSELPAARSYTSGWQLPREPDQVFAMSDEPYEVPAEGGPEGVPYQYFRLPTGFDEDRWVEAAEVQPGNRQIVHHIIVYADPPGGSRFRDRDWIFLTAYVPGLRFDPLPANSAKRIPADSEFIFEMHYTPNGSAQEDISRLGLLYADDATIEQEVVTVEVGNTDFLIPPHAAAYEVTATSRPLARPLTLLSLSPHMHLRGKAFRYELATPAGAREVLLEVPAYDFNWQTRYLLAEPRELPAGAVIHCRATFDNSDENLANPDPDKEVSWGDQSWDEMMLGYFDVILPRDRSKSKLKKPVGTGLDIVGMFDAADEDADGGLDRQEAEVHALLTEHFALIDTSADSRLQLGEILTAVGRRGR